MRAHQRSWIGNALLVVCAAGALGTPAIARAEDAPVLPQRLSEQPVATAEQKLTMAQLKELVGPIALYPDGVLATLLPATTRPLDVIAAARWVQEKGGVVGSVPEDRGWDPSVVALLQFPDVLAWMSENLSWMDQMGRAVTLQQPDVLQAIQDFRREAQAAGNLPPEDRLVVREEQAQGAPAGTTVLVVEPANPQVVYIPSYDPVAVCCSTGYGGGYGYGGYGYGSSLFNFSLGFGFGSGGSWGWYDIAWGWWNPWIHVGWHGGIYAWPYAHYGGQPYPYAGTPNHWTSSYYPPRVVDAHSTAIASPTAIRPVFDGARRTAATRVIDAPRTRLDAGGSATSSQLRTTRPAPSQERLGTAPRAGTTTGVSPGGNLRTSRGTGTDRTTLRPSATPIPGTDPSAGRGRRVERPATPTVRTVPRTPRPADTEALRAPRARPTSPTTSPSRPRTPSTSETLDRPNRGRGSVERTAPRAASRPTDRAAPRAAPRSTPRATPRAAPDEEPKTAPQGGGSSRRRR
jgi:hypothetical protein